MLSHCEKKEGRKTGIQRQERLIKDRKKGKFRINIRLGYPRIKHFAAPAYTSPLVPNGGKKRFTAKVQRARIILGFIV